MCYFLDIYCSLVDSPEASGTFLIYRICAPRECVWAYPSSTGVCIGINRAVGYVHPGACISRFMGPCKNSIIKGVVIIVEESVSRDL